MKSPSQRRFWIDGQQAARRAGRLDESFRLGDVHRDRLVDDDVPAGRERPDRDRDVESVWRRDHDEVDVGPAEQLVDACRRPPRRDAPQPPGPRVPDPMWRSRQSQPIDRLDERRVKRPPGQAVTDESDTDRALRGHGQPARYWPATSAELRRASTSDVRVVAHAQTERRQVRVEDADAEADRACQQRVGARAACRADSTTSLSLEQRQSNGQPLPVTVRFSSTCSMCV